MGLPDRESLTVEFKRDQHLSDKQILDEVVALANTQGGALYIGVEDDGTPTGAHGWDPRWLEAKIAANTVPPLQVRASIIAVDVNTSENGSKTCEVLKIEVVRSRDIVTTVQGKALWRLLDEKDHPVTRSLSPYQMPQCLGDPDGIDITSQPLDRTTLEDLDPTEAERLRRAIGGSSRADQSLLGLDAREFLGALGLVSHAGDELVPTVAGLLLLGTEEARRRELPEATMSFQVLDGTRMIVDEELPGPFLRAIEQLMKLMRAWNPLRERSDGVFSIQVPTFDENALLEAFINAFGHRDYLMPGGIRVLVDETGVSLSSPGGFVYGLTARNLLIANPQERNPLLMKALKRIGLAERTGRGVDTIFGGSLRFGRDLPSYGASTVESVQLLVPRSEPDWRFMDVLRAGRNATGTELSLSCLLVLFGLWRSATEGLEDFRDAYAHQVELGEAKTRAALEQLEALGYVLAKPRPLGCDFELDWKTLAIWLDRNMTSGSRLSENVISEARVVLSQARRRGCVSISELEETFGWSRNHIAYVIRKLVAEGALVKTGGGRSTRYVPSNARRLS